MKVQICLTMVANMTENILLGSRESPKACANKSAPQKYLAPSSMNSASIQHAETQGKITKMYSNNKYYTPGGLELYSTNRNGDKSKSCFLHIGAGAR